MPSTLTVTSCSRKCKGCNYSNCKGRRSRKIGKCEYFCKYIFCCGWCFGTQSRERRPAKITRRVEHVDYIKIHSGTSKHKQKFNGSNKNETADLYFCTVSNYVTTWPNNQRQWAYKRPLATADDFKDFEAASIAAQKVRTCESNDVTTKSHFFISNPINLNIPFHNTRTFGQTYIAPLKKTPMFKTKTTKNLANIFSSCLRSKQRKGATRGNIRSKKIVHPISAHMSLKPDITNILDNTRSISGTTNDFSCQFSVNSMQSLEIISHVLTRSVSRLSSLDSILSLKWRRRFRRHDKQPSTLQTILKLKETGRVRHVGVSNLNEEQLKRLSDIKKPECLQIEIHALCQQESLVAASKELGIPVVAYSPLGSKALADTLAAKTGRQYPDLLTLPTVKRIAESHGRTTGQILLRYAIQRGIAIIPKSTNPQRIKQNISLWDFELSGSEMKELATLDRGENGRICDFSFFRGVEKHRDFPFKKQI
ncbi:prostaglandin F synthase 2 isoform X1 [Manduca sexta]|uniref:prostaglandin F synthase 2 isoform X1 n=1 Tax=Manduca sexta TaxID=7130 RepID=UPI00188F3037|nr:prostaglandin F synthase 2 isoform X1 [Manduca sexta]